MDTGNTVWVLISAALVLLMTPGLAFFYGGLVRQRQVINTIKMSFIAMGVISLEWAIVGYSLAFGEGTSFVGGLRYLGLGGVTAAPHPDYAPDVPHLAFMAFQMMFAVITPALISGAVVGRMKFRAYVPFIAIWGLVVYCPIAHWVWGPGGWIAELGALDFAGGTVVHVSAGVSALVAALFLGSRRPEKGSVEAEPHSVPLVVLGTSLLWFGWIGFNAGSALAADGTAALAAVTTMLAAASAVVSWVLLEMMLKGKPSATGSSIAAVVGLVAVTPAAGFVTPMASVAIGAAGALVCYAAVTLMRRTTLDDRLDVFACHGVGGIVGSVLTGVLASSAVNPAGADGLLYGDAGLLWAQVVGVVATAAYAAAMTAAVLLALRATIGLRTTTGSERVDLTEHAQSAYAFESPDLDPITLGG